MLQCKLGIGTHVVDYWEGDSWIDLSRMDLSLRSLNKILNVVFFIDEEDTLI